MVRDGDRLLDIGCGDGFFAQRFFAPHCESVDAIDIEPSAIRHARRHHRAANLRYHEMDATRERFPEDEYDVIVWDGALGHFSPAVTDAMLVKIARALTPGGVFVGSESLGNEGTDHLQFFPDLSDLRALFEAQFSHVEMRSAQYALGAGQHRREAYWRCAHDQERLQSLGWRPRVAV